MLYARTPDEATKLLTALHAQHRPIGLLMLDHDLGAGPGQQLLDVRPVVRWLAERCTWDDRPDIGQVLAHSSNPAGASYVVKSLERWYPARQFAASSLGAVT